MFQVIAGLSLGQTNGSRVQGQALQCHGEPNSGCCVGTLAECESTPGRKDESSLFATVERALSGQCLEHDVITDAELLESGLDGTEVFESSTVRIPEAGVTDGSVRLSNLVTAPENYLISEATRYFVAKGNRRPGNLGGPLPLYFRDDPNQTNSTEIGEVVQSPVLLRSKT